MGRQHLHHPRRLPSLVTDSACVQLWVFYRGEGVLAHDKSASDRMIMYRRIAAGLIFFPESMLPPARALLTALLRPDPAARLTDLALLRAHALFADVSVDLSPTGGDAVRGNILGVCVHAHIHFCLYSFLLGLVAYFHVCPCLVHM